MLCCLPRPGSTLPVWPHWKMVSLLVQALPWPQAPLPEQCLDATLPQPSALIPGGPWRTDVKLYHGRGRTTRIPTLASLVHGPTHPQETYRRREANRQGAASPGLPGHGTRLERSLQRHCPPEPAPSAGQRSSCRRGPSGRQGQASPRLPCPQITAQRPLSATLFQGLPRAGQRSPQGRPLGEAGAVAEGRRKKGGRARL